MSTLNPILAGSAQSVEAYQQVIEQTSQAVVQWLKQPEMYQGKSVDELRERISLEFNEQGLGNQAAIDRAIEYFLKDSLSVHHPQCVAHLHCPSLVISQAAEVLINATNQSMDSWDQSPSATIIEIKLIEWLRAQVGYGAGDAGVFTSGGMLEVPVCTSATSQHKQQYAKQLAKPAPLFHGHIRQRPLGGKLLGRIIGKHSLADRTTQLHTRPGKLIRQVKAA